jgi:tartronate-semialdehyde synthase
MLAAAEKPLIVAGGGIINADASELLVEFAELTGVPVIPTLMGWGAIPDDHPLMAGMCGLQTSHRYGNATMLASDFVLGIGNRWANRHTGSPRSTARAARSCTSTSSRRRSAASSRPTTASSRDAKAALELFVQVARERRPPAAARTTATGRPLRRAQALMLRKTHFSETPIKPQRVYEEMNKAFGRDTIYVSHHRPVQIAGAQFLHVYGPRQWINCGQAGPLGWTIPAALGVAAADPTQDRGRPVGRLRLPVPDRGAGGGCAVRCPTCRCWSTTATWA